MAAATTPPPMDRARHGAGESGWLVWAAFGGVMLVVAGAVDLTAGLIALARPSFFVASQHGLAVALGWTAWGLLHLAWGTVVVAVGLGVVAGRRGAQWVAVVLSGLSVVRSLLFIDAAPVWMALTIALDVLIIYALVVHGAALRSHR